MDHILTHDIIGVFPSYLFLLALKCVKQFTSHWEKSSTRSPCYKSIQAVDRADDQSVRAHTVMQQDYNSQKPLLR
ncbi:hypothetical protein FKM82_029083 [Ascaphus truei]